MKTEEMSVSLCQGYTVGEQQNIQRRLLSVDGIARVRFSEYAVPKLKLELEYYPLMLDEVSVMKIVQTIDPGAEAICPPLPRSSL